VERCGNKDVLRIETALRLRSVKHFTHVFPAFYFESCPYELVNFGRRSEGVRCWTAKNNHCLRMDHLLRHERPLFGGALALLLEVYGGGRRTSSSDQVAASVQSTLLVTHQHTRYDPDFARRSSGHGLYRNSDIPGEKNREFFYHMV